MNPKEGIRVASVERILQRVRTDDNFTVKPVRYFGQRNGARHNPYAAGVKKYELNGGRFNNDATTAYELPQPIKSRGGRPLKNPAGTKNAQGNSAAETSTASQQSSSDDRASGSRDTEASKAGTSSVEESEIQAKPQIPQRTVTRRSTRASARGADANQPLTEQQTREDNSSDLAQIVVLNEDNRQTPDQAEKDLNTPPPLLQHPISVALPGPAGVLPSQSSTSSLPLLLNRGAQCWIPVAPRLAGPLTTTWCHDGQEHVGTPECYWIASFAPPTKTQRFRTDSNVSIFGENIALSQASEMQSTQATDERRCHPQSSTPASTDRSDTPPYSWTIEEVVSFIGNVPGCAKHAEAFRSQEIDGEALLLLDVDQLVSRLGMKLGPAAKVWARLSKLTGQS